MKGKIIMLSAASLVTVGAALHTGHEPPADGVCPLGKIMHSKQATVSTATNQHAEKPASTDSKEAIASAKN